MLVRNVFILSFTSLKIVPSCNITIADKINLITKNHLSTIVTRDLAEQEVSYGVFPKTSCTKRELLFDISPMMERPLILDTVNWSTNNSRFTNIAIFNFMNSLFVSNPSLKSYLSNYSFFRCHACAYVTVTGTINHQGTLLAGCKPYSYYRPEVPSQEELVNTLMTGPHALLGANEATSSCIEIPFYVATDFSTLNATVYQEAANPDLGISDLNIYSELVLMVLNPLVVSGSTSTTVSVHVQVKINKLEVYAQTPGSPVYVSTPALTAESFLGKVVTSTFDRTADLLKTTSSDFIDSLRGAVRSYTGLHNPNEPTLESPQFMQTRNRANIVDSPTYYEKLDPYSKFTRLTRDAIFHTNLDEMDMNYILSKPQYVGTFKVSSTDTTGTLLFSRPISPWQGGMYGGQALSSNIERLYYGTQAWSGDMELIIQSNMTNKQNLKLLVAKVYGLDNRCTVSYPTYATIKTGITSLLEYSAGNQQLLVDLDFVSRNQVLYNVLDPRANALMHGMYYVFLAQPLVIADSVPSTVEFNVFLRCKENFRFYGYSTRMGYSASRKSLGPFIYPAPTILEEEEMEVDKVFTAESFDGTSAKVMNEPSSDKELTHVDSSSITPVQDRVERMYTIQHLRDLIRRVVSIGVLPLQANSKGVISERIPVAAIMDMLPRTARAEPAWVSFMKMYAGHNMGLRLKLRCLQSTNLLVQYYPPSMVYADNNLYTTNVSDVSHFANIHTGTINSGPICEMPHAWYADIGSQESGCVIDLHIPNSTMYNFWGGCYWSGPTPVPSVDGYRSQINNNGYLIINGLTTPNSLIEVDVFAGLDDESRLGFHVIAPVLFLPIDSTKTTYSVTERLPTGNGTLGIPISQPTYNYYSNLSTTYSTPL